MKVTLNRSAFLEELATVQRAISGKTTIPILTGVKIVLTKEGLTLTGSNADISIETFLSVEDDKANMIIEKTGAIVLQARFFNEIIRKLPETTLSLELIENLVRSRRKWQETWQALMLFMLYLALGTYEWQLCSTLQRFTSCASAVSAIIEQHVLLYKLKKREEHLYLESHILCSSSR